jgi:excisionase family DNA binding protein
MRLLRVPEFAESLNVHVSTVRGWILKRRITTVRVGRSVRVPASEVERMITAGTVPARE